MPFIAVVLSVVLLVLSACSRDEAPDMEAADAPWVRTAVAGRDGGTGIELTGRVHARHETPVAFQVDGRITARRVDSGHAVNAGDVLFELDPRDLREAARAAEAAHEATQAALQTAQDDLARQRDLLERKFISRQGYDRAVLLERAARAELKAAEAGLDQARNALGYAVLHAERAGVLIDVTAEPGQVVDTGQTLAILALDGEREIEVALPDGYPPPQRGHVQGADGARLGIELREVAGAADPASLTWRARYRLSEGGGLALGSVVRVVFPVAVPNGRVMEVPIGALDERAEGPRVWQVVDGKAQPVPVAIVSVGQETARITADLPADARVVAFGTHLLTPGMAVREQRR